MNNPFSLNNKVIMITGASSGIGRQCAISCSEMGAKVILIARNESNLQETLKQMKGIGHQIYSFDVTKYALIEDLVSDSVGKIGKITGFIHSAGIEITKPVKVMKASDYELLFSVNVIAGYEFIKHISKKKYSEDFSSFIFIASIMGVVANAGLLAYCSSKGAIIAGLKSLALELSARGIRVNAISPGHIQTKMMKAAEASMSEEQIQSLLNNYLLGMGEPEDIANAAIYLLSDASKWVTGTNLIVDGGYSAK